MKIIWKTTPLQRAAKEGDLVEVIRLLEAGGCHIDAQDEKRKTALYYAIEENQPAVVDLLLQHGADVGPIYYSSLYHTDSDDDSDDETGSDYSYTPSEVDADRYGMTALLHAAEKGHIDIIKLLLQKGGSHINEMDGTGYNALHIATSCDATQSEECISFLVDQGIDVDHYHKEGYTPLLSVALNDPNPNMLKLLIRHGASIHNMDDEGNTPLHHTARNSNIESLTFLLENGADVNAKNKWGETACHVIGSDCFDDSDIVRENRYMGIAETLINYGAKIVECNKGRTPLHKACREGFLPAVELFLENGASPTLADAESKTPIVYVKVGWQGVFKKPVTDLRKWKVEHICGLLVKYGSRQWGLVPSRCQGLGVAVWSVWRMTPADMPRLFERLTESDQLKVMKVLYAYLVKIAPDLPKSIHDMILQHLIR